jgi:catechol 2,3-dioxygenase-like lactoylglutathione lyase family enzyme
MSDVLEPESLASSGPPLMDLFMTVIRVANWSTIVRWYTDTLGLVPVLLDPKHEFAFLAAGQGRLGLQGIKRSSETAPRSNVRLVFQVDDLDFQLQRLIEQGVEVSAAIDNSEEGYREIRFRDPVGNSLTLFAWLDSVPARRFSRDPG